MAEEPPSWRVVHVAASRDGRERRFASVDWLEIRLTYMMRYEMRDKRAEDESPSLSVRSTELEGDAG